MARDVNRNEKLIAKDENFEYSNTSLKVVFKKFKFRIQQRMRFAILPAVELVPSALVGVFDSETTFIGFGFFVVLDGMNGVDVVTAGLRVGSSTESNP